MDLCTISSVSEYPTLQESLPLSTHPNPAYKLITLAYDLPKPSPVTITIYNITGERMQEIQETEEQPGHHELPLDLSSFVDGSYFIKVEAGGLTETTEVKVLR